MRAFVALELPAAVRDALERRVAAARRRLPAARWVPAANYHLTLVFLGEIDSSQAAPLAATLADVFRCSPAFDLQLGGGGCFPPRRAARVAWVGVTAPPALVALQSRVAAACRDQLGLASESRPYRPHLTVARCRRPWPPPVAASWGAELDGPVAPPFAVREGVLMESRLQPQGAAYRVRARWPLEKAA